MMAFVEGLQRDVVSIFRDKTRALLALLIVGAFVVVAVWKQDIEALSKVVPVVVTAYFVDRAGARANGNGDKG